MRFCIFQFGEKWRVAVYRKNALQQTKEFDCASEALLFVKQMLPGESGV